MNEQELNKKVVEWVGPACIENKKAYKDGKLILPDFPNDLNACEKWIWPKILEIQGYWFELRSPYKDIPYCFIIGKHDKHEAWTLYSGESDNPAIAACLACEKLIDGVK